MRFGVPQRWARYSRWVPRTWRRPVFELIGLILGLVVFSWLHNLAGTDVASATANARALQSAERALHLDIESASNAWLGGHPVLVRVAVLYYRLYYLPIAAVLLWVLFRHAEVYSAIRRTLVVMVPLALLVFWLVPMSPPRFALAGIVDIVADHDILSGDASRDLTNGQNHFSAMPSLHVGWSMVVALAALWALRDRHPRSAFLVWLFPLGMVVVVLSTGAHYVLDVVGSVVLVTVSVAAAGRWHRWRLTRSQVPDGGSEVASW